MESPWKPWFVQNVLQQFYKQGFRETYQWSAGPKYFYNEGQRSKIKYTIDFTLF